MDRAANRAVDAVAFAQKALALLDTGAFTTTYKFATLLAIVDLCTETTATPDVEVVLSGRTIGRRVFESFWSQAVPFTTVDGTDRFLRHGTLGEGKPDLVVKIARFRRMHGLGHTVTPERARDLDPSGFEALVDETITTVIRMPLPKLQRVPLSGGVIEDRFLYEYGWPDEVSAGRVRRPDFDDRVHMLPGVTETLARLAPLLRPAIQQRWTDFVSLRSRDLVEYHDVHALLFGSSRIALTGLRADLADLQFGRCFYCAEALADSDTEIDHFIPWSRHPDNGLDNLVAAHRRCNNHKRDSLASTRHLARWLARTNDHSDQLAAIGRRHRWPRHPQRTLAAARSNYLWLPEGTSLWQSTKAYERLDPEVARSLLGPHP